MASAQSTATHTFEAAESIPEASYPTMDATIAFVREQARLRGHCLRIASSTSSAKQFRCADYYRNRRDSTAEPCNFRALVEMMEMSTRYQVRVTHRYQVRVTHSHHNHPARLHIEPGVVLSEQEKNLVRIAFATEPRVNANQIARQIAGIRQSQGNHHEVSQPAIRTILSEEREAAAEENLKHGEGGGDELADGRGQGWATLSA